jgi:hypothetical protein
MENFMETFTTTDWVITTVAGLALAWLGWTVLGKKSKTPKGRLGSSEDTPTTGGNGTVTPKSE